MTVHLHNARLIDPESLTGSAGSLTIDNGIIQVRRRRRWTMNAHATGRPHAKPDGTNE
jgi:hypothetical protein